MTQSPEEEVCDYCPYVYAWCSKTCVASVDTPLLRSCQITLFTAIPVLMYCTYEHNDWTGTTRVFDKTFYGRVFPIIRRMKRKYGSTMVLHEED